METLQEPAAILAVTLWPQGVSRLMLNCSRSPDGWRSPPPFAGRAWFKDEQSVSVALQFDRHFSLARRARSEFRVNQAENGAIAEAANKLRRKGDEPEKKNGRPHLQKSIAPTIN
jgi:hypothetical protein